MCEQEEIRNNKKKTDNEKYDKNDEEVFKKTEVLKKVRGEYRNGKQKIV